MVFNSVIKSGFKKDYSEIRTYMFRLQYKHPNQWSQAIDCDHKPKTK